MEGYSAAGEAAGCFGGDEMKQKFGAQASGLRLRSPWGEQDGRGGPLGRG